MKPFFKTILLLTALAGTLDILSALTHIYANTGRWHIRIFQGIATGLVGAETANNGGWATHVLGFFIHYFIAFSFILFYFLMYPRVPLLQKNRFLSALLVGIFIWTMMNLIVLPLSAMPPRKHPYGVNELIGVVILSVMIGLPAAIGAERYYGKPRSRRPAL